MVRIQDKRKAEDDKETRFFVRGRTVAQENITRWQKRQKTDISEETTQLQPQNGGTLLFFLLIRL